jgi:hypothetical protein
MKKMMNSNHSDKKYKLVQYVRVESNEETPLMTYREALDAQNGMTKAEGRTKPLYVYKIEME